MRGEIDSAKSYFPRLTITNASEPAKARAGGEFEVCWFAVADSFGRSWFDVSVYRMASRPSTLLDFRVNPGHHGSPVDAKIETERLLLRPLALDDAPVIARLVGRREIADTTISIPHPYSEPQAREWIERHTGPESPLTQIVFAITVMTSGQLIGTVDLRDIDHEHCQAEMGFWIAVDSWGKGYATEAAKKLLRYGFEQLKLNRIHAHYMLRNPASGRVLVSIGMKREGLLRQRVQKWGVFEDVVLMAIVKDDFFLDVTVRLPSTPTLVRNKTRQTGA